MIRHIIHRIPRRLRGYPLPTAAQILARRMGTANAWRSRITPQQAQLRANQWRGYGSPYAAQMPSAVAARALALHGYDTSALHGFDGLGRSWRKRFSRIVHKVAAPIKKVAAPIKKVVNTKNLKALVKIAAPITYGTALLAKGAKSVLSRSRSGGGEELVEVSPGVFQEADMSQSGGANQIMTGGGESGGGESGGGGNFVSTYQDPSFAVNATPDTEPFSPARGAFPLKPMIIAGVVASVALAGILLLKRK
jgi:uncharacterized membrane protein YgcG